MTTITPVPLPLEMPGDVSVHHLTCAAMNRDIARDRAASAARAESARLKTTYARQAAWWALEALWHDAMAARDFAAATAIREAGTVLDGDTAP